MGLLGNWPRTADDVIQLNDREPFVLTPGQKWGGSDGIFRGDDWLWEVKRMWDHEGMSATEIGNQLGCSRGVVIGQINRHRGRINFEQRGPGFGRQRVVRLKNNGLYRRPSVPATPRAEQKAKQVERKTYGIGEMKPNRQSNYAGWHTAPGVKKKLSIAVAPAVELQASVGQRRTFWQLTPDTCRYQAGIDETASPPEFYCGGLIVGKSSYCPFHHKLTSRP